MDKMEAEDGDDIEWNIEAVIDQKGPIKPTDPDYMD